MSVINQVLNQLEQRGEPAAPEQTMVRAVPQNRRSFTLPLLALGLALAGAVGAWQWIKMHKPVLSPAQGPVASPVEKQEVVAANAAQRQPPVPAAPAAEPVSAVPAPAVVAVGAVSANVENVTPQAEMLPPASRLSFELSAIPLPSSLRPFDHAQDRPFDRAQDRRHPLRDANAAPERGARQPADAAQAARPQPARVAAAPSGGASPMKQVSPGQLADAEFRRAVAAMQQGHIADAMAGYRAALRLDTGHDEARQALVALLLENKQGAEAERMLQERLNAKPGHTGFAMLLARLQVEHGALEQAVATLEKSLSYADAQADYQAFFAALLQRLNRHKEAVNHYQIALQLAPDNGIWLMGYGISLQAAQRPDDARDAYRRALESRTLTPELQAFVRRKLKEL